MIPADIKGRWHSVGDRPSGRHPPGRQPRQLEWHHVCIGQPSDPEWTDMRAYSAVRDQWFRVDGQTGFVPDERFDWWLEVDL